MRPTTPNTIPERTLFCKKPVGLTSSATGLVDVEGAAPDALGPADLKTVTVGGGAVENRVGGGVELVLGAGDGVGLDADEGAIGEDADADADADAEAEAEIEAL